MCFLHRILHALPNARIAFTLFMSLSQEARPEENEVSKRTNLVFGIIWEHEREKFELIYQFSLWQFSSDFFSRSYFVVCFNHTYTILHSHSTILQWNFCTMRTNKVEKLYFFCVAVYSTSIFTNSEFFLSVLDKYFWCALHSLFYRQCNSSLSTHILFG